MRVGKNDLEEDEHVDLQQEKYLVNWIRNSNIPKILVHADTKHQTKLTIWMAVVTISVFVLLLFQHRFLICAHFIIYVTCEHRCIEQPKRRS
jgi:hypothetical protein